MAKARTTAGRANTGVKESPKADGEVSVTLEEEHAEWWPASVEVGARQYDIAWLNEEEWARLKGDHDDKRGMTDHLESRIYIRTFVGRTDGECASDGSLAETLLHEILHAVNYWTGIASWVGSVAELGGHSPDGVDLEEYMVEHQAPALLLVLRSNVELIQWIFEASLR